MNPMVRRRALPLVEQQPDGMRRHLLAAFLSGAGVLSTSALGQTSTGDIRLHGFVESKCSSDRISDSAFSGIVTFDAAPHRTEALTPFSADSGRAGEIATFLVACSAGKMDISISATRRMPSDASASAQQVSDHITLNVLSSASVASLSAVCDARALHNRGNIPCAFQGSPAPGDESGLEGAQGTNAGIQVRAKLRPGINTLFASPAEADSLILTLTTNH